MSRANPKRIAILRALQLGDMLVAVPAFRAIRRQFPEAEITLIGLPWAATFARRFASYIDRFVEFPGYPGIDEAPFDAVRTARFLAEQRAYGYDMVVQMHGSGQVSNLFVLELNGRRTVGYYQGKRPTGLTVAAEYPGEEHEIRRNLSLASLLGCRETDVRLEFPLYEEDHAEAAELLKLLPPGRPWIGMHVGARLPARRWPPEHFATLADELVRTFDAEIILTGSADEKMTVCTVLEQMETPTINLAGKTSLGGLAALMSKLALFVSNDTGPAHLAVAVDCPSVTIFGPADPQQWAPLDREQHPIVRYGVACSPCEYRTCPIDHRCLRWLSPEMVLKAAEKLLPIQEHPIGTSVATTLMTSDLSLALPNTALKRTRSITSPRKEAD